MKVNSGKFLQVYDSPLGRILLESDGEGLTGLRFVQPESPETDARPDREEQPPVLA